MKGFLFSIEALLSVALIITALTIVQYETNQPQNTAETISLQTQSTQLSSIYFNLPSNTPSATDNTQYCTSIESYSRTTKNFVEKKICRGIK
jgi:cell division protein FtsL